MSSKQQLDISYFAELQRRVVDVFRYISCHERNFETYSTILESVLVDSASFFDSLCQTMIRGKSADGYKFTNASAVSDFSNKVAGSNYFNIADYEQLLGADFALSDKQVNLNPYQDAFYGNPTRYDPRKVSGYIVKPFQPWATGSPLPWWRAFTALKHDRLNSVQEASLGNVIHAMAATFVVLTLHNELDFKTGNVDAAIYDLFLPKYWTWHGRVTPGNLTWQV